jgi:hypothetical protein
VELLIQKAPPAELQVFIDRSGTRTVGHPVEPLDVLAGELTT